MIIEGKDEHPAAAAAPNPGSLMPQPHEVGVMKSRRRELEFQLHHLLCGFHQINVTSQSLDLFIYRM